MLNALFMLPNANLAIMSICCIDDLQFIADSPNRLSLYLNSFYYYCHSYTVGLLITRSLFVKTRCDIREG